MARRQSTRQRRVPASPADLPRRSWAHVLWRTVQEFRSDNLTDHAAALTYYAVLSIFPALLAVVALLGLIGQSVTQPLIDNIEELAPGPTRDILRNILTGVQGAQGGSGLLALSALAVALWSASGYVAAFMRAANTVYDIAEGRPVWKTFPERMGITLLMILMMAVSALLVVLTGQLAEWAGDVIGVGRTAVNVWDIVKWPVLVALLATGIAILYWAAPNVKQPGLRWVTPGSALAVLLWIAASAGFGLYVANFASYNRTYGALAGVIIFLVWLWISNLAILLGVELDAELQRARSIQAGHPPDVEPYTEPRDTRNLPHRS